MKPNLLAVLVLFSFAATVQAADNYARPFTGKEAANVIGRALIQEGAGEEVRVQINGVREDDQIAVAPSVITASADSIRLDKARNQWEATLLMTSEGKNLAPIKLNGRYDEMIHVPVLKSRMQSGDVITEEDIAWEDVPATRQRKTIITDSKALIGKSPKRVVSANRPIRLDEITGPTMVNKGSQVTLVYKTPNLEIKTLGEAMENGAQGTVIRVKNISSKSIIQGTVEAEGRVRIGSPDTLSAGLM